MSAMSDNDLGAFGQRLVHDAVVVEPALAVHTVGHNPVATARDVELAAVGEVPALEQVHAHQRIACLHEGIVDGQIGCGT
jgi:hypothetical protein